MNPDFVPQNETLYLPWQGKKRKSLISSHVLPRLRRVRFVWRTLRRELMPTYPALKSAKLFAGAHLMDEPFQYVATSIDLPLNVYAAPCMEEFPVDDLCGILSVEIAKALVVLHYAESPRADWPAHMHDSHYRQLASDVFGRQIETHADDTPYMFEAMAAERGRKRYAWLAPWEREESDDTDVVIEAGIPMMQQLSLGLD